MLFGLNKQTSRFFSKHKILTSRFYFAAAKEVAPSAAKTSEKNAINEAGFEISKTSELTLERLKRLKQRFALTKDQYRIDVGLMIDRPPIFLHFSEKEMQNLKYRNYLMNKYKFLPSIPKELLDFQMQKSTEILPHTPENLKTHKRINPDGSEDYYCENSKMFFEVDPTVMDPKSIQRASNYKVYLIVKSIDTGEWVFPSFYVLESQKFDDARTKFFGFLSNNNWKIYYYPTEPYVMTKRKMEEKELEDPRNAKLNGVKTFFFGASHLEGIIDINDKMYSDYAWVTKYELNQYFSRENYFSFIHSLVLY